MNYRIVKTVGKEEFAIIGETSAVEDAMHVSTIIDTFTSYEKAVNCMRALELCVGVSVNISIYLPKRLLQCIDITRDNRSRSACIKDILIEYYSTKQNLTDTNSPEYPYL